MKKAKTHMKKPKRCFGWPRGTTCDKKPGTAWGPYWCPDCDKQRMAHLSKQMDALAASFPLGKVEGR